MFSKGTLGSQLTSGEISFRWSRRINNPSGKRNDDLRVAYHRSHSARRRSNSFEQAKWEGGVSVFLPSRSRVSSAASGASNTPLTRVSIYSQRTSLCLRFDTQTLPDWPARPLRARPSRARLDTSPRKRVGNPAYTDVSWCACVTLATGCKLSQDTVHETFPICRGNICILDTERILNICSKNMWTMVTKYVWNIWSFFVKIFTERDGKQRVLPIWYVPWTFFSPLP